MSKIPFIDAVNWSHSPDSNSRYFDLYDRDSWTDLFQSNPETVVFLLGLVYPITTKPFIGTNKSAAIEFLKSLVKNGFNLIIAALAMSMV